MLQKIIRLHVALDVCTEVITSLLISITQTEEAKSCTAWASSLCHIVLQQGMATWMLVLLVDFLGLAVEMTWNYSPTSHTSTTMAAHACTHTMFPEIYTNQR
jgi:hypothetical protein